jgi:hypothetical protein
MCRFYAGPVAQLAVLANYSYVMRLDTDTSLVSRVLVDPFAELARHHAKYGYVHVGYEAAGAEVIDGLAETAKAHFGKQYVWERGTARYETNLELIDLRWMRSRAYMSFFEALDRAGGFYLHRWGDHVMRHIAVNSLGVKALRLKLQYKHGNDGSGRRQQLALRHSVKHTNRSKGLVQ